jgi:hypothetical protein
MSLDRGLKTRNDSILVSIRRSRGDSLIESPLLLFQIKQIDVVIPNEYAIRRRSEESPIKTNCILAQKKYALYV